jgi:hypothetical protein
MKSKTNQLTLIYIYSRLLGYRFSQTVPKVFSADYRFILSRKTLLFFYWYSFRYILSANDNRNRVILKTQENNDEIKESNER